MKKIIGERFAMFRSTITGLTQKQLAAVLGVTQSAIANYEKRGSEPSGAVLWQLVKTYRLNPEWLFGDHPAPQLASSIETIMTTKVISEASLTFLPEAINIPISKVGAFSDEIQSIHDQLQLLRTKLENDGSR